MSGSPTEFLAKNICTVDNCHSIKLARNLCSKHYARWRKSGDPLITHHEINLLSFSRIEEIKSFLLLNREIKNNGCWEWKKCIDGRGYGSVTIDGKHFKVHRVSKSIFSGFDLNSDLFICHHCDNTKCFNPDHLFSGTNKDNYEDCKSKGRVNHQRGESHSRLKLNNNKVHRIRLMYQCGTFPQKISQFFSVAPVTISNIVARKRWSHI